MDKTLQKVYIQKLPKKTFLKIEYEYSVVVSTFKFPIEADIDVKYCNVNLLIVLIINK